MPAETAGREAGRDGADGLLYLRSNAGIRLDFEKFHKYVFCDKSEHTQPQRKK